MGGGALGGVRNKFMRIMVKVSSMMRKSEVRWREDSTSSISSSSVRRFLSRYSVVMGKGSSGVNTTEHRRSCNQQCTVAAAAVNNCLWRASMGAAALTF